MEEIVEELKEIEESAPFEDELEYSCPYINNAINSLHALKDASEEEFDELVVHIEAELEDLRELNINLRDQAYDFGKSNVKLMDINEKLVDKLNDIMFPPNQLYMFEDSPKKLKPVIH